MPVLRECRNLKMAASAHAYVRGNTLKFYEWLAAADKSKIPQGPPIWICGDCHAGNLGPVADKDGKTDIQIRDFDQTVIGNPAHDLIRLGLSLAMAARGSDLPGITTARMLEEIMVGYEKSLAAECRHPRGRRPKRVQVVMRKAIARSWEHLAKERIEGTAPTIPLGKHFWPLNSNERAEVERLFATEDVRRLVTSLRCRKDGARVKVLDAAYWVKGCSSLGRLRYAVLLDIDGGAIDGDDLCLIDIKEGAKAAAPRYTDQDSTKRMPRDNAERIVEGARHLTPWLGERMRSARLNDRSVVIRELLPQDMKLTVEQLTQEEAMKAAHFLAMVVGKAHARQMDSEERHAWLSELRRAKTKSLDAPSWLWTSIVELVSSHEAGYLEHCRRYALTPAS